MMYVPLEVFPMPFHKPVLLALGLVLLSGCAEVSVRYDFDRQANFNTYKTYDWYAISPKDKAKALGVENPIMDRRVRAAVEHELAARGYKREQSGDPDFFVTYYPAYQNHTVVTSSGLYSSWGYRPFGMGMGTQFHEVQHFREGSIVLEIVDRKTKQMVWQAVGEDALTPSDDPLESEELVNRAVQKILSKFPPPPPNPTR
jgi:hypothetical protein